MPRNLFGDYFSGFGFGLQGNKMPVVTWLFIFGVVMMFGSILISCNTSKQVAYFQNLSKDTVLTNLIQRPAVEKVAPGDLLSITVSSLSPENSAIYNAAPDALGEQKGYLVSDSGTIEFVKLGSIVVKDLSEREIGQLLSRDLEPFVGQNVVSAGIINRHVTMMGGISPQVLPLTKNMTLLDALASSGDINMKGKVNNVLVIRSSDDGKTKTFNRINLKDQSVFYSPYYYLQPDDIVYVEPREKPVDALRVASFALSTVSLIIAILARISK